MVLGNGGHDAEYLYDVLKHFPKNNSLRQRYLGEHPSVLCSEYNDLHNGYSEERQALISVEDASLCTYIGQQVSDLLSRSDLTEDEFEGQVLTRMVELGPMCNTLIAPSLVESAKNRIYDILDNDRLATERDLSIDEHGVDQTLWLRDDIGHFASRLNWDDMLLALRRMKWYWTSQFSESYSDQYNDGLLAWSLRESDEVLKKRALDVMKHYSSQSIDGAIAWKRLHPGS